MQKSTPAGRRTNPTHLDNLTLTQPLNENPPGDLSGSYQWSPDLVNWYAGDGVDALPDGPALTFDVATLGSSRTVTATSSAPWGRVFIRARAELNSSP